MKFDPLDPIDDADHADYEAVYETDMTTPGGQAYLRERRKAMERERMSKVSRVCFEAYIPLTAKVISQRSGVRLAGVMKMLGMLERAGKVRPYGQAPDGQPYWEWVASASLLPLTPITSSIRRG